MSANVELRLCGAMDHLRITWQTGETLLESIPFVEDAEGTRYNILLAVQEMVTNVLRHAYSGRENDELVVGFEADDGGIAVEIRDTGPEFDPLSVEPHDTGDEFPDAEGGYGIMITRMVMDDLQYRRETGWNVLRMYKAARPVAVERR